MLIQHYCHAFTLEIPELTTRIVAEFVHSVEEGSWQGDQSVWIANDDPKAAEVAFPCPGDHLRAIPLAGPGAVGAGGETPSAKEARRRKTAPSTAAKSRRKSPAKTAAPAGKRRRPRAADRQRPKPGPRRPEHRRPSASRPAPRARTERRGWRLSRQVRA